MKASVESIRKRLPGRSCYILYTVAFIPIVLFLDALFRNAGMNFVRRTDGISQHFNSLLYLEKYLRAVFGGEGMGAPLMNYTLGQGADIITTLGGYDLLNPVCIISVLLFSRNMFFAYEFMVLANLFLAGLAFCLYCRSTERENGWHIASGALVYAFSGFALTMCTKHPNFVSGMYYFPLMLASTELLIKKNRRLPLILTVFFSLMTSYYMFYMDFICFAVYLLIRFFPCPKDEIKTGILAILKTAVVTIVGGLLSAVWILPALYGSIFGNGGYKSLMGYTESMLRYPAYYYKHLIEYFMYPPGEPDFYNYLGFVPMAMICLLALFMVRDRQLLRLRLAVIITVIGMCVPLVGLMFNAFRYVNNRWTYIFAFVLALACAEMLKYLPKLNVVGKAVILAVTAGIVCLWLLDPDFDRMKYIPFAVLIVSALAACICGMPRIPQKMVPAAFFILVILSVAANITILYGANYGSYVNSFCEADEGYGIYTRYSSAKMADSADDEDFYRVEMQEERENTEGYNNVRGTTLYYSAIDKVYGKYYTDLQMSTSSNYFQLLGLGGSAALLDLASVKYFTLPSDEMAAYIPYGYKKTEDGIYRNTHYLPPAFLYENRVEYDDFKDRNPADRQRAMLQGAVLEEIPANISPVPVETRVRDIEYSAEEDDGPHNPGMLFAGDDEVTVTVSFDAQPGCELYLWLDGVAMGGRGEFSAFSVGGGIESEDGYEEGVIKSVLMTTPAFGHYYPRDGICFNLGYSEEGYNCCKIYLDPRSNFTYTGLHILANPMDTYDDDIAALRKAACDDITIADDHIYGTVTCEKDSLLQLSVPYSTGWKAYVDGRKAHIYRSNIMYTALELAPGSHEIELRYRTPYLTAGIVISVLTLVGMIVFAVFDRKHFVNYNVKSACNPQKERK